MDWDAGMALERSSGNMPYLMIADRIEREIRTGGLKPDERLPTTVEISRAFGVTMPTAQHALSRLVKRGLLCRRPKHGTFVSPTIEMSTIALLTGANPYMTYTPYPRLLLGNFQRRAAAVGCRMELYVNMDDAPSTGIRDLERAISESSLKAVVAFSTSYTGMDWLQRLDSIPWIHIGGCDIREMTRQGVSRLLADGARDMTIFSTFSADSQRMTELEGARQAFAEAGLPQPDDRILIRPGQLERDGYEAAKALLSNAERRPRGLLVNHDVLTRGVVMAILELGLRIPGDLAVVTHENKGAEIVSPFPMPRLQFDPDAVVADAVSRILGGGLVKGKNESNRIFPTVLVG